ncbi:MAG: outer membrane beta-barrel protein, partial [Thermoguttaceae bacterium]
VSTTRSGAYRPTSSCSTCSTGETQYYEGGFGDQAGCSTCGPAMMVDACGPMSYQEYPGMDCYNPCGGMMDMGCGVFPYAPQQWFLDGWLQQGVMVNPKWPDNRSNGPLRYTDRASDYQMNQLYLTAGRMVNTSGCYWDIGGRVDLLYGTDYFYTSALGLETGKESVFGTPVTDPTAAELKWNSNDGSRRGGTAAMYGLAMPQLYGEIQAPIGTNVKLGHFYSPMGHESVMATQNFFYTHSYSMMYGEPTTLTGMLISQRFTYNLTGYFGINRGWDVWDSSLNKVSYMAGAKWENVCKTTSLGFLINTGAGSYSPYDNSETTRTNYSLIFSQQLTPALSYVLQHDLGIESNAAAVFENGNWVAKDGEWYSIAQYIYLQVSPTVALGCRAEWFKDKNHTRVYPSFPPGIIGDEFIDVSLGLNWKPTPCINLRPEVRWDWVNGGKNSSMGVFDDFSSNNQFLVGLDLVITFR